MLSNAAVQGLSVIGFRCATGRQGWSRSSLPSEAWKQHLNLKTQEGKKEELLEIQQGVDLTESCFTHPPPFSLINWKWLNFAFLCWNIGEPFKPVVVLFWTFLSGQYGVWIVAVGLVDFNLPCCHRCQDVHSHSLHPSVLRRVIDGDFTEAKIHHYPPQFIPKGSLSSSEQAGEPFFGERYLHSGPVFACALWAFRTELPQIRMSDSESAGWDFAKAVSATLFHSPRFFGIQDLLDKNLN